MSTAPIMEPPATPTPERRANRGLVLLAAACAAATLGIPFGSGFIQLRLSFAGSVNGSETNHITDYAGIVGVVVALLVLRLFPRRGWAWLLLTGSVIALPLPLSIMDRDMFAKAPAELLAFLIVAAMGLVVIGALGGAAWVAAQVDGAGAALTGATVVVPGVGVLAIFLVWFGRSAPDIRWLFIGLAVLAVLGGLGAVIIVSVTTPAHPIERPGWRIFGCGVVAATLPVLLIWTEPEWVAKQLGYDPKTPGRFLLVLGLTMLVLGTVTALVAGRRILVAALAGALVSATVVATGLYGVAAMRVDSAQTLPALFGGIALGWVAGVNRWRAWIAVAGLGVCAFVMFVKPTTAGARSEGGTLTVVLMVAAVAAGVAAIAALVAMLTEPAELPATFGPLAATLQVGCGAILSSLVSSQTGASRATNTSPIMAVAMLLGAAVLVAIALWHQRHRSTHTPDEDDEPREPVWYQLPPEDRPQ